VRDERLARVFRAQPGRVPYSKTQIGARPTKRVEAALVAHEGSTIGRKASLTSFCVNKYFLEVVRTLGFGSQENRHQSRLDFSELVKIQASDLSLSIVEEITTTARKIKRLDWTSKSSPFLLSLVSTY